MQFNRKFLINGKDPNKYTEGTTKEVVFTDVESGETFGSFFDMTKKFGCGWDNITQSGSFGTDSYHRYSPFSRYVYTDGVHNFCEEHKCWWLQDVITSYYPYVSNVLIQFKEDGRIDFVENERGKDDFLVISLIKTSDNSAVFTVEMEHWNEEKEDSENISIVTQYIPYTDIDVDQVAWYSESGVVLEPMEH